jgi:hypothetical protein
MVISCNQNAGQNHNLIAKKSFENVEKFKHLETKAKNQHRIHEQTEGLLKLGNACHHHAQNLSCNRFLSRNLNIQSQNFTCCYVWV